MVIFDYWFVYRDTQKLSDTLRPMGEKYLKRIVKYLYCTKYNEINIGHSNIQKHVSYEKCYKKYKYFVYRLKQKLSDTLRPVGKLFKTYLYFIKYNEIHMCQLDV